MKITQILGLLLSLLFFSAAGSLENLLKIRRSRSDISLRGVAESWRNLNVIRVLDLQKRYPTQVVELTAEWLGKDTAYKIPIRLESETNLASLVVQVKKQDQQYERLYTRRDDKILSIKQEKYAIYSVNLKEFLKNSQQLFLRVEYILKHKILPEPHQLDLTESQKLRFSSHLHYLSAYSQVVSSLSVLINSATDKYMDFTVPSDMERPLEADNLLIYKFEDAEVARFETGQEISFLYRSPIALVYFAEVLKQIEISHWGNIWVQENYFIVNEGAQIKREFSRADYSPSYIQNGRWAFKGMETALPLRTRGLYLGDVIGNISSSTAFREENRVTMSLTTRFPLFGGQQVKLHQGYNLPLQNYLNYSHLTRHYHLTLSFMYSHFQKIADKYVLQIVLPAGAKLAKISLPFKAQIDTSLTDFGYLDLVGKQKVRIELEDATEAHNVQFEMEYEYSPLNMAVKPVYLISLFFGGLVVLILGNRANFSIKRKRKSD